MLIKSDLVEVHLFREKNQVIEFLLLKRAEKELYPGLWQMVSGKVEPGEKAYDAALREMKEETGLYPLRFWVVPNVNLFYSPEDNTLNLLPVFAALVPADTPVILCEEHCEWGWFLPEESKNKLAWDGQKRSVDIIVNYFTFRKPEFNLLEIKIK